MVTNVELLSIVDSSSDGAVARDVFTGIQKDLTIEANPTKLEDLDATGRVNVFKAVFALNETGYWRSREVRSLKVRRYTAEGRTEEKEIDEANTSRLTSAIFKGKQIDEDDYVKQLMAQGYFFRSADLITFNPSMSATGRDVVVTINFSENPNVLLVSAREHAGDGSSTTVGPVAEDELVGIAEYFWRNTYRFLNAEFTKLKRSGKPAGKDASPGTPAASPGSPSPGHTAAPPPPSGTSAP